MFRIVLGPLGEKPISSYRSEYGLKYLPLVRTFGKTAPLTVPPPKNRDSYFFPAGFFGKRLEKRLCS